AAMAALPRHRRFLGGFVCGAAAGAVASCWATWRLLRSQSQPEPSPGRAPAEEPIEEALLERYGFPEAGTETRCYTNHALSYDQAKRVPRWVIEHLSKQKMLAHECFSEIILFSFSVQRAMAETFYLSNIVPQNYENNAGFWNRMEMYCRELTERFEDVWVVSGPLTLPQTSGDGKKSVTYQVIGKDDVAVPSHLYKVILARRSRTSPEPLVLGAFVVPNDPIGFSHQLTDFQVSVQDLERMSGLVFFPQVDKTKDVKNICEVDSCKLMGFKEFTLYVAARKVRSARTLRRLEKAMAELQEAGIEPDEYLLKLYKKKEEELLQEKPAAAREGRAG
ncbi:EXOG Nuclease, partial [Leiothrix lutea]|nr:EXOG Nuclease [Leiothrix lutea]